MWLIPLLVLVAIFFIIEWVRHVRRYPPGPFPLPIIGNLHHVMKGNVEYGGIVNTMKVWQKKYGNVFTVWLGPLPTVHIVDYETAKEEMVNKGSAYADRYTPHAIDVLRKGRGVIFSSGDFWVDHRRFIMRTLRDTALRNDIMEARIMDEFCISTSRLRKEMVNGQKTVNAGEFFDLLVGSVINRIVFSEGFSEENTAEFFAIKREFDKFATLSAFDISLPKWTVNFPPLRKRWRELIEPQERLVEFIAKRIAQRRADIASGKHHLDECGTDFVDAYLIKMENDKREGRAISRTYKEDELLFDILDLWLAGQETTTTTLMWGLIHLIRNPDVVDRIRSELHAVTKGNRMISLADKDHTPYLNWTILEIHRFASIFNLNFWRRTREDTCIGGHSVPKGTAITAELSVIVQDEKYFEDCYKFNPDRYMEGGKSLEQHVIPFGLGKRSCIGETLAKAELYLILSNLIATLDIQEDPAAPIDLHTSTPIGLLHRVKNFDMIMRLRQK